MATITIPGSISSALKPLNLGNYTASMKTKGSANEMMTGRAIDEIQALLNNLVNSGKKAQQISGNLNIFEQEVNLDGSNDPDPTTITAAFKADVGELLAVFVNQDSVGGHKIAWDPSTFGGAPPPYVDPTGTADVTGQDIKGDIDGSNTVFYLPSAPVDNVTVLVNSVPVDPLNYTIQGNVLTLAAAPAIGAVIEVAYDVDAMTLFLWIGRIDPFDNVKRWFFVASWPDQNTLLQDELLEDASTTISPLYSPIPGTFLLVSTTQDGTGGRAIVWGPGFDPLASTSTDTSPNSVTRYLWVGHYNDSGDPTWYLIANSNGSSSANIFEQEVSLTTTTTINASTSPQVNSLLCVFITQDGTGGHGIAWGTGFASGIPTLIDPTPDALTLIIFVGREDPSDATVKWFWASNTFLEQSGATPPIVIGLDDDTVGSNVVGKYLNIMNSCIPIRASISVVGQPMADDVYIDLLYSVDYGANWISIFPTGMTNLLKFPKLGGSPPPFPQNRYDYGSGIFNPGILPIPGLDTATPAILRVDVAQSGGATGILIELDVKAG